VHIHLLGRRRDGLVVHLEVDVAVALKSAELKAIIEAIAAELSLCRNCLANELGNMVVVPLVKVNVGALGYAVAVRNRLGHEVNARHLANLELVLKELGQGVLVVETHIAVVHGQILRDYWNVDAGPVTSL